MSNGITFGVLYGWGVEIGNHCKHTWAWHIRVFETRLHACTVHQCRKKAVLYDNERAKKKLSKQYNLYQNDLWKKNLSLGQSNKFSVCHFRFAWIFLNKKIILIVYHFDLTTKATQFTTNLQESNIKTTNDAKILFTLGYKLLLSVIYFVFFFLLCFALCACAHCFTIRWRYSVIALPSSFR